MGRIDEVAEMVERFLEMMGSVGDGGIPPPPPRVAGDLGFIVKSTTVVTRDAIFSVEWGSAAIVASTIPSMEPLFNQLRRSGVSGVTIGSLTELRRCWGVGALNWGGEFPGLWVAEKEETSESGSRAAFDVRPLIIMWAFCTGVRDLANTNH